MKFRNQFDNEDLTQYINISGTKEIEDYEVRLNSNGIKQLIRKQTKKNIYDRIQAAKDECDIYEILRRSDPNMRESLENRIIKANLIDTGEVYDLTDMPTSLVQARQMLIDADNKFKTLPLEVRKEFNNNANEFLAAANNGTLQTRIDKLIKKIKPEVKDNEPTGGSVDNTKSNASIENNKNQI